MQPLPQKLSKNYLCWENLLNKWYRLNKSDTQEKHIWLPLTMWLSTCDLLCDQHSPKLYTQHKPPWIFICGGGEGINYGMKACSGRLTASLICFRLVPWITQYINPIFKLGKQKSSCKCYCDQTSKMINTIWLFCLFVALAIVNEEYEPKLTPQMTILYHKYKSAG